jgi:hypothetical protein
MSAKARNGAALTALRFQLRRAQGTRLDWRVFEKVWLTASAEPCHAADDCPE